MPSDAAAQRALNKKLSQIFRMRGLSVKPDAMQPLYDVLQGDEKWETTLQAVLHEVQNQDLPGGNNVDAAAIKAAISCLRQRVSHKPTLPLEVIDAFSMPLPRFDKQRRALVAEPSSPSLHAPASAKGGAHALRLAMVEQRVRRHPMFKPPVLSNGVAPQEYLEITGIDALLGRGGTRVILGMLAEAEEGVFCIEDAHASIEVDLSDAACTPGLFTRHATVLAEGEVLPSGVFKVHQLGLPPHEPKQKSTESLGGLDLLHPSVTADGSPTSVLSAPAADSARGRSASGAASAAAAASLAAETATGASSGSGLARKRSAAATKAAEIALQNAWLVVLSDVWLDSKDVLGQLATLFAGYEAVGSEMVGNGKSAVPRAAFFTFVLCGNFTSSALAPPAAHGSQLKLEFAKLAALLAQTPVLAQHAHFVLVPGPNDPSIGPADVLPRAPLSRHLTSELQAALGHLELASSPCRMLLCGQTVVVHREELLVKARRACVLPPDTSGGYSLNQHLIKSVVDQAHLCPLPQSEAAVYWQLDHSMWLHPAPDVLVLCDRQPQFQHTYEETIGINPGAFASDLSWFVYRPETREAEPSSLEAA